MTEHNPADGNSPAHYIQSRNMGNTMDNKQRNSKVEDALNPDYTNPPIGREKEQENSSTTGIGGDQKEENS